MEDKKVVSIEDHIPKLKQARKKKANRRLIFYLFTFFFLVTIIVYLQTPLSDIKTISIHGIDLLEEEEVFELSGLEISQNIWSINKGKIKKTLEKHPLVKEAHIKRQLPWQITVDITEYLHIGYVKKRESFYPVLGNGTVIEEKKNSHIRGDAPLLVNFKENEHLENMAQELGKLPKAITHLISEIHWEPSEKNKHKVILYMNDGYTVSATIRDFSKKMELYPSIVSQIEEGKQGMIHIGVGTYFEEYRN
ncbi:MAG TPA: FtsQ-type POTRA domain-containing protein [Cerasibacillus sp.]|uniref:cell division protein FtsQ/DivIB n=1 Tax=Cerasibacillus sp. TaxID=2498711 RepID=UPI002F41D1DC